MIYQNDLYTFTLFITHANGTNPSVTSNPFIQIVKLQDFSSVLGVPAAMTNLDSTNQVWAYTWNVGGVTSGEYLAIVSYVADSMTFNSFPVEKVHVGDSRIVDVVAIDNTVAKDATVAKDSTVAHVADVAAVNPDTSIVVLAIKAKTDALPIDPAGMTLLSSHIQNVADLHDAALGSQTVDKTINPALYTLKRLDNSILAQYSLSDDSTETSRTKV